MHVDPEIKLRPRLFFSQPHKAGRFDKLSATQRTPSLLSTALRVTHAAHCDLKIGPTRPPVWIVPLCRLGVGAE